MEIPQRFCVRWNSYKSNLQTAFPKLLTSEHFVDVTLACEKQFIKCHKIVLSACSVYFESLLVNNPCQHPIIFMKDVQFWEIKALVEFMYKGEVNVSQNQLDSLLKSAESLQIRGLSGTKQFKSLDEENVKSSGEGKGQVAEEPEEKQDEEVVKRRKRKCEETEEKPLQITSVRSLEETKKERRVEDTSLEVLSPPLKGVKEEVVEHDEFDMDANLLETADEDDTESFSHEDFYHEQNSEPGPSGMSEFISLDQLSVDDFLLKKPEAEPSVVREPRLRVKLKSELGRGAGHRMRKHTTRRSCYKQYTMSSMWAALERIEQGLSVYRASLEYGVPRKTLRNWMKKYNILSYFDLRKQEREKHGDVLSLE